MHERDAALAATDSSSWPYFYILYCSIACCIAGQRSYREHAGQPYNGSDAYAAILVAIVSRCQRLQIKPLRLDSETEESWRIYSTLTIVQPVFSTW